jgi:GntR family transcriptional regulator
VERINESATYVVPPEIGNPDAWTQAGGSQRLLEVGVVVAAADVRAALKLPDGAGAVRRSRLILRDGEPMEVAVSYWSADWAAGTALAEPRRIKGGTMRLLADMGWRTRSWTDEVDVLLSDEIEEPGVPVGVPMLAIYRTMLSESRVPFEYIVMYRWNRERQRYSGEVA